MSKLIEAVRFRFRQLEEPETLSNEGKVLSTRVSADLFDKVEYVASILEMSKSDFLRMIITNALDDIIEEFKISFASFGLTPSQIDDLMKLPVEERQAFFEKCIQQEAEKGDEA